MYGVAGSRLKSVISKRCFFLLFLFSLVLNIIFSSCDDDGYSLGNFNIDYAVVNKDGNGYTIRLDGGQVLYPSVSYYPSGYLEDKQRVLVNFTLLQDADTNSPYDYYVKVNELYKILTKDVVDYHPLQSDSLGHDPVSVNELRLKNGYITFDFFFGGGQPGLQHMVNLARHPEKTADGRILLDFRHNAFGDAYNYRFRGLVAFPIDEALDLQQDSVQFRVRYDGLEKEENLDVTWYKKSSRLSERSLPFEQEFPEGKEWLR